MKQEIQTAVVGMIEQAISMMDELMRGRVDLDAYSADLESLDPDAILERYQEEFKRDEGLVYCLDALMMLSSLRHELAFQVAEYGVNVASEDIKMLKDILAKLNRNPIH